jgi:hypothetical protein
VKTESLTFLISSGFMKNARRAENAADIDRLNKKAADVFWSPEASAALFVSLKPVRSVTE